MTEREKESTKSPVLCYGRGITETAQVSYEHVEMSTQSCSAFTDMVGFVVSVGAERVSPNKNHV